MKEELNGKLIEILTGIQSAVGKASDFAMEQLPDIAMSYVAYGRVWGIALVVFALAFIAISALVAVRGVRYMKANIESETGFLGFVAAVFGVIGVGAGVLLVVNSARSAVLVWMAPKVWLLMELSALIR